MGFTSNAVKRRYNDKTYCRYTLQLRKVEDADLIARIETLKAAGFSASGAIKKLIETEENKMKAIIKLTQDAYAAGGSRRLASEDGKDSIYALSGDWYEAWAVDDADRFQSTRPVWGATAKLNKNLCPVLQTFTKSENFRPCAAFCPRSFQGISRSFSQKYGANLRVMRCTLSLRTISSACLPADKTACIRSVRSFSHTGFRYSKTAGCPSPRP